MGKTKADIKTDIDAGENIALMEPLLVSAASPKRPALSDLVIELVARAASFRRSLPASLQTALADIVRAMNCYYSNLIEGHNTHPVDIEKALNNDYSKDVHKRNLQLEAKAHITVQRWLDEGGLKDSPYVIASLCEIHQRFTELLPDELLWVKNPTTGESIRLLPGELRHQHVAVGNHFSISPGALPRFLTRFTDVFTHIGKSETILSAAAAHHRLLWIHPFMDGNGRVARLMSHAVLSKVLDSGGLWSIARGLARNANAYKVHLANCDLSRRNDLDGRGNLSEEALVKFTEFFLQLCIDQIDFMENLMQPQRLNKRILISIQEDVATGELPTQAVIIMEAILYRGELARGDVASLINVTDRHARRIVAVLLEKHIITSATTKAPLQLAFPARLAGRWLPGLFPEM